MSAQLRDVYNRERQLMPCVRQTLWQTNALNTILMTKTTYVHGYFFAEMTLDAPEYSLMIKESLENPAESDTKVTFVRLWASSATALMTLLTPIINEIKGLLYPETIIYASIGPNKNVCGNFELAPPFVRHLFL